MTSTQLDSELSNWFRLTESTTTTEKSKRADLEVTPSSSDTSSYINTWAMFNYRMYLNHLQNAKWSGALVSTITTE